MAVHAYNTSCSRGRERKIAIGGQPQQKVHVTPSQPMAEHSDPRLSFQLGGEAQIEVSQPGHEPRPYP
jgi:hypothetical protein